MTDHILKTTIDTLWDDRDHWHQEQMDQARRAVACVLSDLDRGALRACSLVDGDVLVHEWVKKAILLTFRLWPMAVRTESPAGYDKLPLKTDGWDGAAYDGAGFRQVPGAIIRYGAYVAPGAILMPSFVNVGAHVGAGTMVDTWSTIGSCAQVGRDCHISGGVGIGGVLEPLQAHPVVIEDNVFIGARSEVVEGVRVGTGAVLGMGVFLGASTPIIHRETGVITYGYVPPYAVVLQGTLPGKTLPSGGPGPHLPCAIIVKQVDARTRSKTAINDLLRA